MNFHKALALFGYGRISISPLIISYHKHWWAFTAWAPAACTSGPQGALDGEIYCAFHNLTDWNPLLDDQQLRARENGQVLLEHRPGELLGWIEAPPFTSVLK